MTAIPYTVERRPDTGVNNVTLGIWLFLASEVMLFGGLFSAYFMLRSGAPTPWLPLRDHLGSAALNTVCLLGASVFFVSGLRAMRRGFSQGFAATAGVAITLDLAFLAIKRTEYAELLAHHLTPAASTQLATYYLLSGVHVLHVVGGLVATVAITASMRQTDRAMLINRAQALALYWVFVDVIWLILVVLFYVV